MGKSGKKFKADMTIYLRSCLVTLGLFFLFMTGLVLFQASQRDDPVPAFGYGLLLGFFSLGSYLIAKGLFGQSKGIEKMADAALKDWTSILVMLVAFPVYLILRNFYKDGR